MNKQTYHLNQIIYTISKDLDNIGAKLIIVGGNVRDYYLHLSSKDYDLEVYGLSTLDDLEKILASYGDVNLVGKSFGVLKFRYEKEEYDFSFPRRESKIDVGHRGFDIELDSKMSFKEASQRRDFTINSMGYDIKKLQFLDPYNGLDDIKNKKLRCIDEKKFQEDPLRVYRAIQFCARFEFTLEKNSFILCQKMVQNGSLTTLPKERIYTEFTKLLLKANRPSLGFELMKELGVLTYFSELEQVDFKKLDYKKLTLFAMFVILLEGLEIEKSKNFLYKITDEHKLIKKVLLFIKYFKTPSSLFEKSATDVDIRRLAKYINIEELVTLSYFDNKEASEWLLQKAIYLGVQNRPLQRLLEGKDLIKIGKKPSPKFREILESVYELQIEGTICNFEDAILFASTL